MSGKRVVWEGHLEVKGCIVHVLVFAGESNQSKWMVMAMFQQDSTKMSGAYDNHYFIYLNCTIEVTIIAVWQLKQAEWLTKNHKKIELIVCSFCSVLSSLRAEIVLALPVLRSTFGFSLNVNLTLLKKRFTNPCGSLFLPFKDLYLFLDI